MYIYTEGEHLQLFQYVPEKQTLGFMVLIDNQIVFLKQIDERLLLLIFK